MHTSFNPAAPDFYHQPSFFFRDEDGTHNQTRFADISELDQPTVAFHHEDAVNLSTSSMYNVNMDVASNNLPYGAINMSIGSTEIVSSGSGCLDTGLFMYQKGIGNLGSLGNGHIENWGDSGLADHSQQTDTSTDVDNDDRNQLHGLHQEGGLVSVDSIEEFKPKRGDEKMLRRLAQNREAAKKSRLRKKVYVQQLESSRIRLSQLEQELQRARQQGYFTRAGTSSDHGNSVTANAALAFDLDHSRWLEEQHRMVDDLLSALNSQQSDGELRIQVDVVMAHYDELFRLKNLGTRADVFHMLSGMWKTPAERCFMWLGGFRSSEILKIVGSHLEPLTDQQLMGICNLQQSSQQAEDALSQGMEALQQSLVETLSSASLGPIGSGNVTDYMTQMGTAMGKLGMLESFLHQADLLRQQTLQQMHRILTTRQAARALLVISDYSTRLRALSSLWLARPRD